ncbi:hypothetical protein ACLKA7_014225 [Drosophila subpalustris]
MDGFKKLLSNDSFDSRRNDDSRPNNGKLPCCCAGGFLLFWIILFFAVVIPLIYRLPTALTMEEGDKNVFIAERAYKNLYNLSNIGIKLTGTEKNEVEAVNFILNELKEIKDDLQDYFFDLEIDLSHASGSFITGTALKVYQGVQNIAVKLSPKNTSSESYLLVNSHFDSMSGPGAGDAGFMIVTMLEVLRVIATSRQPIEHPIVFLFNGAEEVGLLASHGFITQHKWAPFCKAVINLDAAGSGGRDVLFQTGPNHPWLVDYYKKYIKHPFPTTMAEEIFQSGIIPSDTDFRQFKTYGKIPGLDMAQCFNGFVYHTKYDTIDVIPIESLQNTGDNVLGLVRGLANATELHDTEAYKTGHAVYFDFLGIFFFRYSETTGILLNVAVAGTTLILVSISMWRIAALSQVSICYVVSLFLFIDAMQAVSFVLGVFFPVVVAYSMDSHGHSLTYYSNPTMIIGLYVWPSLVAQMLPQLIVSYCLHCNSKVAKAYLVQLKLHGQAVNLALVTIFFTCLGFRSSYVFAIPLVFYNIALVFNLLTSLHDLKYAWAIILKISQIIPFLYSSSLFYTFIVVLTPMGGRSGSASNWDINIAILAGLGTVLSFGFLVPLINTFRRPHLVILSLLATTAITILLACHTQLGFPYRPKTNGQRIDYLEVRSKFYEFDGTLSRDESGYLILYEDRRREKPLLGTKMNLTGLVGLESNCKEHMMCGMPLRDNRCVAHQCSWLPRSEPIVPPGPTTLEMLSKTIINATTVHFEFKLSGPNSMSLFIRTYDDVTISNWSFLRTYLESPPTAPNPRRINFWFAKDDSPINFFIEISKSNGNFNVPLFEVGVSGHYVANDGDPDTPAKAAANQIMGGLPWFFASGFVVFWAVLFFAVVLPLFYRLPTALTLEDANKNVFIGERAYKNLYTLSNIGTKLLGSTENEVEAVNFIMKEVTQIQKDCLKEYFDFEIDLSRVSGGFQSISRGAIAMYQGIQNIVVKISPKNSTSHNYLLVNSHFDSKPATPSAGDAGFMIVTMLEVLRVIATSRQPIEHPIVFLFNGAEEVGLLASHGFITQHKWAPFCKAVINLDAAGSGGRDVLFQTGPNHPWLVDYYKKYIKHPFATTMAEEIFQSGIIPSDTDFRQFKTYGNIPGLDMAQCFNGFVYHTKYDTIDVIPIESLQNTGDNVLGLVRGLANATELHNTEAYKTGHAVYFDFLGLYFFHYSEATGKYLNFGVAGAAILLVVVSMWRMATVSQSSICHVTRWFILVFVIQIVSFVLGLIFPIVVAYGMDSYGSSMTYYSTPLLVIGLYVFPSLLGLSLPTTMYYSVQRNDKISTPYHLQLALHSQAVILALLAIAATVFGLRSSYIFVIPLLFYVVSLALNLMTILHDLGFAWTGLLKVSQIIPFLYSSYLVNVFIVVLTPMGGRAGSASNRDLYIAVLAALGTVLSCGFLVPLINTFRRPSFVVFALLATTALSLYLASSTQLGFPYRPRTNGQRVAYLHVRNMFYEYDGTLSKDESGYLFNFQDRREETPFVSTKVDLTGLVDMKSHCEKYMMCGMPLYDYGFVQNRLNTKWLARSDPVEPPGPTKLELLNKTIVNSSTCRFEFVLSGPPHMSLFIEPYDDVAISDWSFLRSNLENPPETFYIIIKYGVDNSPVNFFLEISLSDPSVEAPAKAATKQIKGGLPWYFAGGFVVFWAVLFFAVVLPLCYRLPTALTLEDANKNVFIAERAYKNLNSLSNIGIKFSGTEKNEVKAVNFILSELDNIKKDLRDDLFDFEVDLSQSSSSFFTKTFLRIYQGVQNIAVKLSPKNTSSETYLLVNSHFDSGESSPGAGDAGFMIVTMLEVLRVIATSRQPIEHPIVFLFNGAEEVGLLASHGFITQHKWAPFCKAVINLDAAGSGGRDVLFQTGPNHPWLVDYYKKYSKHPFATTMAEEIFQSGIIPSDTDFRQFKTYGNIPGLDMAQCFNGFVYHTKYDTIDVIPIESLQNTGDNVLGLVRGLANATELHNTEAYKTGHAVYFDFLGLYFFHYSEATGQCLNFGVAGAAILLVVVSMWRMATVSQSSICHVTRWFILVFVIQIVSFVLGLIFPIVVAYGMDSYGSSMTYYSTPLLVIGLYVFPSLLGLSLPTTMYYSVQRNDKISTPYHLQLALHSQAVILALLAIAATVFGLRSSYIFVIPLLFYVVSLALNLMTILHDLGFAWTGLLKVSQIIPFLYSSYLVNVFIVVLTPMGGRAGSASNRDLYIAVLAALGTVLSCGFLVPLINTFRRPSFVVFALLATTALSLYLASSTQLGFPYRPRTNGQRVAYLHVRNMFYEYDGTLSKDESGYLFNFQDRREETPFVGTKVNLTGLVDMNSHCEKYMMCGMPLYIYGFLQNRLRTKWLARSDPIIPPGPTKLELLSKTIVNSSTCRFELNLTGPSHMSIFIKPYDDVVISNWSFLGGYLENPPETFHITIKYGIDNSPVNFFLEISKSNGDFNVPLFQLGVSAHYIMSEGDAQSKKLAASFPSYSILTEWPALYQRYIF